MSSVDFLFREPPHEGHPVDFVFGVDICYPDWLEQRGDELEIGFDCCGEPQDNDWSEVVGTSLVLDAREDSTCAPGWASVDDVVELACPGGDIILDLPVCDLDSPNLWHEQPGGDLKIDFNCCGAEEATLNLGIFRATEGLELQVSLSPERQFIIDLYDGAAALLELNTRPIAQLRPEAYDGAELTPSLSTVAGVPVLWQEGGELFAVLSTLPAALLEAPAYTGETLDAVLQKNLLLPADAYTGEQATGDLTTEPYQGFVVPAYTGEELQVAVEFITGFQIPVFTGETVTSSLASTASFNAGAYAGETMFTVLDSRPASFIVAEAYEGASLVASLATSGYNFGQIFVEIGEQAGADFTNNPQIGFQFNAYAGETALLPVMSWAANLGIINFSEGASGVVNSLDAQENILVSHGETLGASIATEDTFVLYGYDGAVSEMVLKVAPSEPIGQFNFHTGEQTVCQLAVLRAIPLAVTFYDSYTVHAGINASTWFDLDVSCCSSHEPPVQDMHRIELNEAEFSDQRFDGDKIRINIDMQTQPRFRFDFHVGETMVGLDADPYLRGFNAWSGEQASFNLEAVIDFALCPGNFIPDGDNVYVELDFNDEGQCKSDFAFEGQRFDGDMQIFQNYQPRMTEGQSMVFDLTFQTPWRVNFLAGEHFSMASNSVLDPIGHHGETMGVVFYEPPIIGAHGETLEATLIIKYDVKFNEVGCLENEYMPTDENGDPIEDLFNTVPVELDRYQHDIKGACE